MLSVNFFENAEIMKRNTGIMKRNAGIMKLNAGIIKRNGPGIHRVYLSLWIKRSLESVTEKP